MSKKILEPTKENIKLAVNSLRKGGIIVCPTDCNVGLTVDPNNGESIDRTFRIKKRPPTKPLTLFIEKPDEWENYGQVSSVKREIVEKLINAFWPGPLNIILPKTALVPEKVVCNGKTVSITCMSNPVLMDVLKEFGRPIAMTSANISGQADDMLVDIDTALEHVGKDVDYILRGSAQGTTKSSTIIDLTNEPKIVRHGDITIPQLNKVVNIFNE